MKPAAVSSIERRPRRLRAAGASPPPVPAERAARAVRTTPPVSVAGLVMSSPLSAGLMTAGALLVGALTAAALTGCEPTPDEAAAGAAGAAGGGQGLGGEALAVPVPAAGRTYARLSPPAVVGESDDWDLAFEGYDVFTHGGATAAGSGAAFGPHDGATFAAGTDPSPFYTADRAGGAFTGWYAYEGSPAHVLWSRYHVHAVAAGERRWKVQVLGYYGELDGAPVSALYRLRYAELNADGTSGETHEPGAVDATAGGNAAPADQPSACLDLGSGQVLALTPDEAAASTAWHVCLRREAITVNGERGGPGAVSAVDLDEAQTAGETVAQVKTRTADSERARFDAVTRSSLEGRALRGDRVISMFGDAWVDRAGSAPAPRADTSWAVVGPDGQRRSLVLFSSFDGATAQSPGTVNLRIKSIKANQP